MPGQGRLCQAVEAGVEGMDRKSVVGGGIEQSLRLGAEVGGVFASALGENSRYPRSPVGPAGFDGAAVGTRLLYGHRFSCVVAACDLSPGISG